MCVSVNDPFVMEAWGKANNVGDKIIMIADPFLELTKKLEPKSINLIEA